MLLLAGDTCSFGGLTLGATDDYGVEWYFLDLDGWGAPQSTVQAVQKANADGAFATPAFLQARVVTVTGAMLAPDRPTLVAAWDRLQAAAPLATAALTVVHGGADRYVNAQRQGEISMTEMSDVAIQFSIQWLCVDPRKFATDTLTATTGLPSASGGLTIPFTVPFTIASTVVSGTCFLTNPGNANGPVNLHIAGGPVPCAGPSVTHVASGLSVTFASSLVLTSTDYIDVDMDNHTVILNGTASRDGYVTSRGWSPFTPGVNEWAFTSVSGSGASLTVTATPAWY